MLTLVFLLALCAGVYSRNITINPGDSFIPTLQTLAAGDIVNFLPGTHVVSSRAGFKLPGTVSEPIIIQGLGSGVIVQRNDASNNIWDFSGTNFIIRNIEFIGGSRGLRIGDGGNALFEDIKIHETESTAWSFNDYGADYNNVTARRVEIYNTGSDTSECIYPGCNSAGCVFRNSVFEYIFCHDTLNAVAGYGSGINLKSGSYNNIVRHSVFWNVKGPGVFFYDSYDMGDNIAYNNLIVNSGDNGIQVTAGVVIENNIVINSAQSGIAGTVNQLKANTHARNIKIRGNTVVGSINDACLRGNDWGTNQNTIVVANNAFFCQNSPNGAFKISGDQTTATWLNNGYIGGSAPTGASAGVFVIANEATELADPTNNNYYPKSTSALLNAGSAAQLTSIDFNCNSRNASAPTVGAYQYSSATNPGWAISKQMKPDCGSAGTTSGGTTTDGGSTTGDESAATRTGIMASLFVLMFLNYLL